MILRSKGQCLLSLRIENAGHFLWLQSDLRIGWKGGLVLRCLMRFYREIVVYTFPNRSFVNGYCISPGIPIIVNCKGVL